MKYQGHLVTRCDLCDLIKACTNVPGHAMICDECLCEMLAEGGDCVDNEWMDGFLADSSPIDDTIYGADLKQRCREAMK